MKKALISLIVLTSLCMAVSAAAQCPVDMGGARASFGFDGATNTLYVSNIRYSVLTFTVNWKLNLQNGNWDIHGTGGTASGSGGLIDFSAAQTTFSGCIDMEIRGLRFDGRAYTVRWRLNQNNANWDIVGVE